MKDVSLKPEAEPESDKAGEGATAMRVDEEDDGKTYEGGDKAVAQVWPPELTGDPIKDKDIKTIMELVEQEKGHGQLKHQAINFTSLALLMLMTFMRPLM